MEKNKKILFMCQFFYPEYISSATLPLDTAIKLSESGYDVSVICGFPKEYNKEININRKENYKNIKINRIKYLQLKRGNFVGRVVNYFSFTLSVFIRLFSFKKYDAIIVYSNPPILPLLAYLSKKIFGNKVVFVCYDVYPELAEITNSISKNGLISHVMNYINRKIYKYFDRIVVLSGDMKNFIVNNRDIKNEDQIVIIPNWNSDNLKKILATKVVNDKLVKIKENSEMIVSYFGNMGICQDLETITQSMIELKHFDGIKFIFAGHGNKIDKLKLNIINKQLNNVEIFDFLHGDEFMQALKISDVFLVSLEKGLSGLAVPSKTYTYMMAGKPIISIMDSNSDLSRELENSSAGFSVDVGASKILSKKILYFNNNKSVRAEMGKEVKKIYLKKYETDLCTNKYLDLFNELLIENER